MNTGNNTKVSHTNRSNYTDASVHESIFSSIEEFSMDELEQIKRFYPYTNTVTSKKSLLSREGCHITGCSGYQIISCYGDVRVVDCGHNLSTTHCYGEGMKNNA